MTDAPPIEPTEPVAPTPTPDELAPPDTSEDRLNELEAQVLAKFQTPEEPAPGTPAVEPQSPPTAPTDVEPGTEPVGVAAAGEGSIAPSPAASIDDPTVEPTTDPELESDPAAPPSVEVDPEDFTTWSAEDQQAGLEIISWARSLDEDARLQVNAVLSGNYALVPLEDVPKITAYYQAQSDPTAATPPGQSPPPPPTSDDWGDLDPDDPLVQRMAKIEAENARLLAAQAQVEQATELDQARQRINAGAQEWMAAQTDLTDAERQRLSEWVVSSGTYVTLAQSMPPEQAIQAAYAQGLAADQGIQKRRFDAEVSRRVTEETAAAEEARRRAANQSALAGSGASVPSAVPAAHDPDEGMVAAIRAAQQQG